MNLEQIDTGTTAGKAEVMRLAAEGRRVAIRTHAFARPAHPEGIALYPWRDSCGVEPIWDWHQFEYAIIAEPVGPEELWAVQFPAYISNFGDKETAYAAAKKNNGTVVRYIRADLAGEKGAESREERLARYRQTIAGESG